MVTLRRSGAVKRTWWALPYFGGVLAVIVVAAAVTAILHTPRMGRAAAACLRPTSGLRAQAGPRRCPRRCSRTPCSAS